MVVGGASSLINSREGTIAGTGGDFLVTRPVIVLLVCCPLAHPIYSVTEHIRPPVPMSIGRLKGQARFSENWRQ